MVIVTVEIIIISEGNNSAGAKLNICSIYSKLINDVIPVENKPLRSVLHNAFTLLILDASSPEEYFLKKFAGKDSTLIIIAASTANDVLDCILLMTIDLRIPISCVDRLVNIMNTAIDNSIVAFLLLRTGPVSSCVSLGEMNPTSVINSVIPTKMSMSLGSTQSFIYSNRSVIPSFFNGKGR